MASAHFEKQSITTGINICPREEDGLKGPIASIPHSWKGQDNMLGWSNCGGWWIKSPCI